MKKIIIIFLALMTVSAVKAQQLHSGHPIYSQNNRIGIGAISTEYKLGVSHGELGLFGGSETFLEFNALYGWADDKKWRLAVGGAPSVFSITRRYDNGNFLQHMLAIKSNGQVGIGTVAPTAILTLKGNSAFFRFHDTANNGRFALTQDGNAIVYDGLSAPSGGGSSAIHRFRTYNDTNSTLKDRLTILKNGNIGLGTTSPEEELEVVSDNPTLRIRTNDSNQLASLELDYGSDDTHGFGLSYSPVLAVGYIDNKYENVPGTVWGDIEFRRKMSGSMVNTMVLKAETGNVGIGTTSPNSRLEILDSQDSNFSSGFAIMRSTAAQTGYINMVGGAFNLNAPDGLPIKFRDGGNTNLTILGDGSVGIGSTSPSEKLEVNGNTLVQGNIESKKVRVAQTPGNWPDYVFAPNYELPTLNELEQYIKTHQHLPEVPSAKEIEKDGQDLGDIQTVLLKKLEEMTLHMIEMNKKIESQSKRILELEEQNKTLKN